MFVDVFLKQNLNMHDVFLVTHDHLPSSLLMLSIETKKFKYIYDAKIK
jgi:hypothetical protein